MANIDFNKQNSKSIDSQTLINGALYEERFSVERTNDWTDAFKTLLAQLETKSKT